MIMKTLVVTGASQGLGHKIAERFQQSGWKVIGTGRSVRPSSLDGSIEYSQFDASDSDACTKFWKQLKAETSQSEICLVNNAGCYVVGGLLGTKPEDYEKQMSSNYFSAVHMTRSLVEAFPKAKIINIISNSALAAHPTNSAYGASKAATKHFFQSLQREFTPENYQITNLYPSDIASNEPNPEAIEPHDLAGLVLDLAESEASYYLRDATPFPVKRSTVIR